VRKLAYKYKQKIRKLKEKISQLINETETKTLAKATTYKETDNGTETETLTVRETVNVYVSDQVTETETHTQNGDIGLTIDYETDIIGYQINPVRDTNNGNHPETNERDTDYVYDPENDSETDTGYPYDPTSKDQKKWLRK
jgi:Zn-finger domain-containing protein